MTAPTQNQPDNTPARLGRRGANVEAASTRFEEPGDVASALEEPRATISA